MQKGMIPLRHEHKFSFNLDNPRKTMIKQPTLLSSGCNQIFIFFCYCFRFSTSHSESCELLLLNLQFSFSNSSGIGEFRSNLVSFYIRSGLRIRIWVEWRLVKKLRHKNTEKLWITFFLEFNISKALLHCHRTRQETAKHQDPFSIWISTIKKFS